MLSRSLLAMYRRRSRRHWRTSKDDDQHYFVHSPQLFGIFAGDPGEILYAYTRAFLTAEIIRPGATVLDIGCGDGSLTKRFYAPRASHVDAIDIEESAIAYATKFNAAPNIEYRRLDAVAELLPRSQYDVIVFDGAVGHFSREGAIEVLRKIATVLGPTGIFCGSESLGAEGHDHLQYFMDVGDLRAILAPAFRYVRLKTQQYHLPNGFHRREAYWRASNADVLGQWEWQ